MTNEKITIPREVAEAIEYAVNVHSSLTNVLDDVFNCRGGGDRRMQRLTDFFDGNERGLMRALVNGYQVEQTSEEKLRDYYEENKPSMHLDDRSDYHIKCGIEAGVLTTLSLLGITIEGINA